MEKVLCEHFNVCGGCSLLNMDYNKQLTLKQKMVQTELQNFNITAKIENTIGMYYPFKYRNKVHLAVRGTASKPQIGFFVEGTNKIVSINKCLLHDCWVEQLINIIKEYVTKFNIYPYDKKKNKGMLKYVVARYLNNELLLTLVTTSYKIEGKQWLLNRLVEKFKTVSFYLNINTRTDNAVFEEQNFVHIGGYKKIRGTILDVKFELSPNSFFQVNSEITEKIYKYITSLIKPNKNSLILDLYSGIGITSCVFAKNGAKVVSIESVPQAVNDAKNMIKLNNLQNLVTTYLGRCEQLITKINFNKIVGGKAEVNVFVDPPRIGCIKTVIEKILELQPNKIVYLSCNPQSLARDLKLFLNGLYKIELVQPFDMFPQTNHIETVCVLKKMI